MKVNLTNWLTLVLFIGFVSEVYLVSPLHKCSRSKNDCDRPPKHPGKLTCQSGEMLVDSPPCCEPTCCTDCSNVKCPLIYVRKPTCVCKPGLVRYDGVCIKPCQCPRKEEEETEEVEDHEEEEEEEEEHDDEEYEERHTPRPPKKSYSPRPVKPSRTPPPPPPSPPPAKPSKSDDVPYKNKPGCQKCHPKASGPHPTLPCSCYPPPPVAPPNPCGNWCASPKN